MKYAIVNGTKTEALKGGKGICPNCNSELIAKCGDIKINHWAHKAIRNCDTWWENETEWHRNWKNNFPIEWQEIVHFDKKGEKHIADVKTNSDWVLEFQHSYLRSDERNSRIAFYNTLIWVVDGLRRKTDKVQFNRVLGESSKAPVANVNIRKVSFPDESRLLKEWLNCGVPVFFDFKDESKLWFLLPLNIKGEAYLIPFSRNEFIKLHIEGGFDEIAHELTPKIRKIILDYHKNMSNSSLNSYLTRQPRRTIRRRRF